MLLRIAHMCINVKDLSKSIDFYERVLRIKRKFLVKRGEKSIGAYFEICEGNFLEISEKPNNLPLDYATHMCFETDSIDEMRGSPIVGQ